MDDKTKTKWVKALRSGEYKQGDGVLRVEDEFGEEKFCCLGVLCDLVEPNQWKKRGDRNWASGRSDNPDTVGMPRQKLLEKLGLNRCERRGRSFTVAEKLAAMNDKGESFEEIADWIETHKF